MKNKSLIYFICFLTTTVKAQLFTIYPGNIEINGRNWYDQNQHNFEFLMPGVITSPSDANAPTHIYDKAKVEFVSNQLVHLKDGFEAGLFTSHHGRFHAGIDESAMPEVVIINNPYVTVTGNEVHVKKWEKFEVGVHLPKSFNDAIENFFTHYFATNPSIPVDVDHDLNPYADDTLELKASLTSPSGQTKFIFGFYMRMGKWDNNNGDPYFPFKPGPDDDVLTIDDSNPLNDYPIRFRFAPDEASSEPWQLDIQIKANGIKDANNQPLEILEVKGLQFYCDAPLAANKGFLKVNKSGNLHRYLQFDTGEPFYGIGNNINAGMKFNDVVNKDNNYPNSDVQINFKYMQKFEHDLIKNSFGELHSNGGNFARIIMFKTSYAFEHEYLGVYDEFKNTMLCCDEGLGPVSCNNLANHPQYSNNDFNIYAHSQRYGNRQANAWAFDDLLDHARSQNIYLQVCMDVYHSMSDYQSFQWGDQCYYNEYVKPTLQLGYNGDPGFIDSKKYFDDNNAHGSLYYWKRHYKYFMARYGYSVNLAIVELFNEIDGTLRWNDLPSWALENSQMCASFKCAGHLDYDPLLHAAVNNFISNIVPHAKNAYPYADRMFSVSYMDYHQKGYPVPQGVAYADYFQLFQNPNIDVVDIHSYNGNKYDGTPVEKNINAFRFDLIKEVYTKLNINKPIHIGEGDAFLGAAVDVSPNGAGVMVNKSNIFNNLESTLHNSIWSSLFMNTCINTKSWQWEIVHWFLRGMHEPAQEQFEKNTPTQGGVDINPEPTNFLGEENRIAPDPNDEFNFELIANKKYVDHYQPLFDFIQSSSMDLSNSFDSYKIPIDMDASPDSLETYYFVDAQQEHAFGWMHNVNKYWEKEFYYKRGLFNTVTDNNYFGCVNLNITPIQAVRLSNLLPATNYDVEFYATKTGMTNLPTWQYSITSDANGRLTVPVQSTPVDCDPMRSDFGFKVKKTGLQLRSLLTSNADKQKKNSFNFYPQPNPNNGYFDIVIPKLNTEKITICIYNLSGQRIFEKEYSFEQLISVDLSNRPKGIYSISVFTENMLSTKRIIIQ